MFIHSVYFWLKPDVTDEARAGFVLGLQSLVAIDAVESGHISVPAGTRRTVVDHTYSYSLVLMFRDGSAHERYQLDPIHQRFREECSACWSRLVIYDSSSVG